MAYRAPLNEINHVLNAVLPFHKVAATEKYEEATPDMVSAILEEAAKLAQDVMAPLNRVGDENPAVLENGVVRTAPGFKEAFGKLAEGGWVGINADQKYGGMGLPITVLTAVGEMTHAANMALALCPLLSQGQIEALEKHASDAIKDLYLPRLISGQWTGTMNLTEPHAGTDVGDLRSKATRNDDGTYAISGQKIFITWGEHDVAENICHLVLARLPDGVPGTKGISLFMVPKFIPDADGNLGDRNSLRCVSLEHKMGIHGSPTAVMQYDDATGWLVGEEHTGMKCMFTMMNNARLAVGIQGVAQAEAAYQHALAYAMDRKQGKTPLGEGTIIDHADVRRMLLTMKTKTAAARAIGYDNALSLDMAAATGDENWKARAAFLTPINKAFSTDTGVEVADIGVQIHGGMGFIEETGAAQYLRDARINPIYEGTNGIQAMDMVARKFMDGGAMAKQILDEVTVTIAALNDANMPAAKTLSDAHAILLETTDWMAENELNDRFAGAVHYLRAFALVLGAHYLGRSALADADNQNRTTMLNFFAASFLPQVSGLCAGAEIGADVLYEMDHDGFAA